MNKFYEKQWAQVAAKTEEFGKVFFILSCTQDRLSSNKCYKIITRKLTHRCAKLTWITCVSKVSKKKVKVKFLKS